MSITRLIAGLALVVIPSSVGAAELSWDRFELQFYDTSVGGVSEEGYGFALSLEITDDLYLVGDMGFHQQPGPGFPIDVIEWRTGLGYHWAFGDGSALYGELYYQGVQATLFGSTSSDGGQGIAIGLRSLVSDQIELEGGVRHVELNGGGEQSVLLGAAWRFSDSFALTLQGQGGDVERLTVGLRFEF